jgi:hypothetical protein
LYGIGEGWGGGWGGVVKAITRTASAVKNEFIIINWVLLIFEKIVNNTKK